jgi:adenylate cyclase
LIRFEGETIQKGLPAEAIPEIQPFLADNPTHIGATMGLACAYNAVGRKQEAAKLMQQIKKALQSRFVGPQEAATYYAVLGEKELVLRELEKLYQRHGDLLPTLKVDPTFDSLRTDPRYAALIRKMKL